MALGLFSMAHAEEAPQLLSNNDQDKIYQQHRQQLMEMNKQYELDKQRKNIKADERIPSEEESNSSIPSNEEKAKEKIHLKVTI